MQTVLKESEKIAFSLRTLYKKYGYLPYHMSKFEVYDLYANNKDFLRGGGVITFNDTDGKLLALKPDVTLSIIKNGTDGEKQKVYYHENVYRISGETKQFKELVQVGLECIGNNGIYDVYETLYLAAASLKEISQNFVLDISHLGILEGMLETLALSEECNVRLTRLIAEKNVHEIQSLCQEYGVDEDKMQALLTVVRCYGKIDEVLQKIRPLCKNEKTATAYSELESIACLLKTCPFAENIRLDFSVVNNRKYYNGITFTGFVDGVAERVLSGGQYDALMQSMGRRAGAIGFAVYLDTLSSLHRSHVEYDVDVLFLYDETTPIERIISETQKYAQENKSVRVQKEKGTIRAKEIICIKGINE